MAEPNGDKWEARWQQWEKERDEFRRDLRDLLTAQVIQKSHIDDLLTAQRKFSDQLERESAERRAKDAALDMRVDKLVSAIGDLISRIPPQNLSA